MINQRKLIAQAIIEALQGPDIDLEGLHLIASAAARHGDDDIVEIVENIQFLLLLCGLGDKHETP